MTMSNEFHDLNDVELAMVAGGHDGGGISGGGGIERLLSSQRPQTFGTAWNNLCNAAGAGGAKLT